ncbi:hypothetical protein [Hyalangium versicolor]|uniref:hypothetical protein n=1 Tax=Hyalangium versicolor TaxID=2861190 RepID=UPI001CCAFA38|nr:hypothetical protein [Hyalangium versicolor]
MNVPSGPSIMGLLLRAVAELPREPSTDILVTQAFLQADARAFQSPEFRAGLVACLAAVRYPEAGEAREQDVAQWEQLLSEPLGEQLLSDPRLTPEQRVANLSFFLLRRELPVPLLSPAGGNLTSVAAHEAQLAIQAFAPEQVASVARFPVELAARFPELARLTPPVDAQTIAGLIPETLPPEQAARILDSLADEALASTLEESPVKAWRQAFGTLASEGIRALAEQARTETEPQRVAQLLVLGGLQHQAFSQSIVPLTEDALARNHRPPGAVGAVGGVARELISTSVVQLGMALGGPVGVNAAKLILRKVFQTVDSLCEGGKLPLGALAGEVLGIPGLGLAPGAIGEVVTALTQLYANRLAGLEEEEGQTFLEELLPLLFRGEVEGLGAAWNTLLNNPEHMEFLRDMDGMARAQALSVLLVGGAVGAFPWEEITPTLQMQGQAIFSHALPADTSPEAVPTRYAASAALAVAVLANEEIYEQVCLGVSSPEEALTQAREFGSGLFAGGTDQPDALLSLAMLRAITPVRSYEATDDGDGDDED